ncbi:uncharacterized protein LOC133779912 [Humulus lupulus]|uniref:uncharacterized protein LOC133779912 n=1 Tax=Humulus lupulus TaxID=3486 RepID=UPI002B415D1C|nr:uncharacterized protein LOC133779912 [Humulus lupulus]
MASPKNQSIKEVTEKSPMTSASPSTQAIEEAIRKSPQKSSSLQIHAREETNEKYSLKPSPLLSKVKSLDIPSLRPILMENEHFTSRVSVAYRIQVLRNIRSLLCYEDLEAFTASCFGHLLKLIDLAKSSGQLIHFLLQRRVQTNKENELWFDIDN